MGILSLPWSRQKPKDEAAQLILDERTRRRAEEKELKREATIYQHLIVQRLNQLNLCYRYKKKEQDWFEGGIQSMRFLRVAANLEAIYLQVDTRKVPRGIRLSQLEAEDTLRDLSASCQRPVKVEHGKDGHDFWYVVERLAGVGGIPAKVPYEDMMTFMPKTAGPLTIPIGWGPNKRQIFASLDDMEQILVGGARGQGKSNFIDAAICTLIQRNTPDQLRMIMIDLKIVELTKYTRIPHLLIPVVVDEDGIMPALRIIFNEVQRRMRMFRPDEEKEPVCINIQGWNHKFRNQKLPYWLLVIDEMAEVTAVGGEDALFLLQRIGALGRAAGVYGMLATQRPSSAIIPGEIKAHYPTRIAFSCADGPSSMTLVDNYDAVRLPGPGHMIFGYRDKRLHLKAPLLGPNLVEKIVADVLVEKRTFEQFQVHNVTKEDIFRFALENFDGDFNYRKIWEEFRKQGVARKEIEEIGKHYQIRLDGQTPDDKIIYLDGQTYVLVKGDGTRPRHLLPCAPCPEDLQPGGHPETVETAESCETLPDTESIRFDILDIPFIPLPTSGEVGFAAGLDWLGAAMWWEGDLRQAIKDWKYRGIDDALPQMCQSLNIFWQLQGISVDIVVPVPLHAKRLQECGFNQAHLLAEGLEQVVVVNALIRKRHTQPQYTMCQEFRVDNVQDAFALADGVEVKGLRVLLVDDVMTTGATLSDCARALREGGAVWVGALTLARPRPKTLPEIETLELATVPALPASLGGNGDGADEGAVLLGALDADANGAVDDNCEACRAANDGWCPGTCETIQKLNEKASEI